MSNLAKLKKKAADFELKKQFDRALAVYVEILDKYDDQSDEVDVALFNRVGDLLLRQGNVADAVDYYERAIDKYADGGFFNNAIALCNKVLRHSPGRASVYYKLGKISAHKGFKTDAKKNFLEYADRMQQAGNIDEAFRSLKEFADLCPDQDDIRLMLADQLSRKNRPAEALEQLELLYSRYLSDGRDAEAKATLDRMKAIDPDFEPQETGARGSQTSQDLIFLDLSDDVPRRSSGAHRAIVTPGPGHSRPTPQVTPATPSTPTPAPPLADLERTADLELTGADRSPMLDGLEPTTFDAPATGQTGTTPVPDLEPTSFDFLDLTLEPASASVPTPPAGIPGLEFTSVEPPTAADEGVVAPDEETPVLDFLVPPVADPSPPAGAGADLDLVIPDEAPPPRRSSADILADMESPLTRDDSRPPADIGSLELDTTLEEWTPPADDLAGQQGEQPADVFSFADDLPLMDLELPPTRPTLDEASLRKSQEIPELSVNEDLDAILDAAATEPATEELFAEGVQAVRPDSSVAADELTTADEDFEEESTTDDDVASDLEPLPLERTRRSTMMAAQSVELLRAMVEGDEDPALRRKLGEAMLDSGDREGGVRELEGAMLAFEQAEDLSSAASVADEIGRVAPESVKIHQKRVEYAFRINDKDRLCEAYMDLADSLRESGQDEKARTVYQRVLDLRPDELRAQAALESITEPEPAAAPEEPIAAPAPVAKPVPASASDDFINLGDLLREDEGPKTTRFTVDEHQPSGNEAADFADMLRKFKQGVAENVDEGDHQSHYDLGVAFKEMGLIDEAIAEFQKALRAPTNRLPTYEALGQCFVEKEQYAVASAILSRSLTEASYTDEHLIGVLYLLGRAAEGTGNRDKAIEFYQRVFMVDIQFHDVADRLAALEQVRA
jgi:tetratricopeptide (TPR) repeat protein